MAATLEQRRRLDRVIHRTGPTNRGVGRARAGHKVIDVTADAPTILATSGGIVPGARVRWELGGLTEYALDLAGIDGRRPKVCFLATAVGDDATTVYNFYSAAQARGLDASHLALFAMPNVEDVTAHLLEQDVVWVWGGSVAGLLAMWRLHGVDTAMRAAWQAGVVLTGVSAGSICWHVGGTTDSFGPDLQPVTDGLALLPYSNGVHYDSEKQRRPVFQSLIADGTLPAGYATDDGAGLLYRGTELVEAVTEKDDKAAYRVERGPDGGAVETRLDTRRL
jgi:peptidase E